MNRFGEEVTFIARGRHDPCVVPRAVPVVEAMAAMLVLDMMLEAGKSTLSGMKEVNIFLTISLFRMIFFINFVGN